MIEFESFVFLFVLVRYVQFELISHFLMDYVFVKSIYSIKISNNYYNIQ